MGPGCEGLMTSLTQEERAEQMCACLHILFLVLPRASLGWKGSSLLCCICGEGTAPWLGLGMLRPCWEPGRAGTGGEI